MSNLLFSGRRSDWSQLDPGDPAEAATAVLRSIVPSTGNGEPSLVTAIPVREPDYLALIAQRVRQGSRKLLTVKPGPSRARRNNNPLNLEGVDSETGRDKGGFSIFATPRAGLAAASGQLLDYWKDGNRTIESIIGRHSPKEENNTEDIIGRVSKRLGIARDAAIDLRDPAVHIPLLQAMMPEEAPDTRSLYRPQDYRDAFQAALQARGIEAAPSSPMPAVTAPPLPSDGETDQTGGPDDPPATEDGP
jgi:hypothetical protein